MSFVSDDRDDTRTATWECQWCWEHGRGTRTSLLAEECGSCGGPVVHVSTSPLLDGFSIRRGQLDCPLPA